MSDPIRAIDLRHLGHAGEIAAWLQGDVLVDCGPTTTVQRLVDELGDTQPQVLLLTHIHLDHAGAAGSLVERWPSLQVHVHPVGLAHLADPSKLVRSAARLYGEEMDRLWGAVRPVPERNLFAVADGTRVGRFLARHTPGHASHHVAYLDEESGRAFTGDATGVRLDQGEMILPHAPPPDIDLNAWHASLDIFSRWAPEALCLPHFGVVDDTAAHLEAMREALTRRAEQAHASGLESFVARIDRELDALADPALAGRYRRTAPPDHMYLGLRRFWDKTAES